MADFKRVLTPSCLWIAALSDVFVAVGVVIEALAEEVAGIVEAVGVTWCEEVCQGGMEVEIDGNDVVIERFVRPGSSPVETLSSGLLIQHWSIKATGS
jgi:hypothetical protein